MIVTTLLLAAQAALMPRPIAPRAPVETVVVRPAAGDGGTRRTYSDARRRIAVERDAGRITRAEARGLRREARADAALTDRLATDGLSAPERREVDARSAVLRDRVSAAGAAPRR